MNLQRFPVYITAFFVLNLALCTAQAAPKQLYVSAENPVARQADQTQVVTERLYASAESSANRPEQTQAATIQLYISPVGNDSNPGTAELPLASLQAAVERLRDLRRTAPADSPSEIIIQDGEYDMTGPVEFGPADSGTPEAPLTIRAAAGAHPVFYGGKRIEGFKPVQGNLWRVKIPESAAYGWRFEQLYVNGKRAVRACSPNTGFYFLNGVSETVLHQGTGRSPELAVQKLSLKEDGTKVLASFSEEDFQDAVITFYHKWDNTRKRLAGFVPDSSASYIIGEGMKPWNRMDKKTFYKLENYRAALDTCGEWFLDKDGFLYYMPFPGEKPETAMVMAPVAGQFLVLKGNENGKKVEHIRFEGLSFQFAGYRLPASGMAPAQAASPVGAVIMADYARNIEWINCEVAHTGTNAVWLRKGCSNCLIRQNYFHDLGAGGIKIGDYSMPADQDALTHHIVADNNIIRSGGFVFPCAVGVTLFHAGDCEITHNEIADFRYSGVSVGWVWGYSHSPSKRNKIEFNHIHHLGWGELSDMGGVYCLGESEGTTVSNNVIHHVYAFDYGGWGLYTDEGSTGIVMENNLVYNCKSSGFHQHYGKENIIRNNIFANNLKAQLQATRVEDHLSFTFTNNVIWFSTGDLFFSNWEKVRMNSDYNCYWHKDGAGFAFGSMSFNGWQQKGHDQHSVIADPGLADPVNFDFRLTKKAVARKIGFKPFDFSQAGVYGSDAWKKLAAFDPAIASRFDQAVSRNEALLAVLGHK